MPTVVVTGATGFIGSHVCPELARNGWTVKALSRKRTELTAPGVEPVIIEDLLNGHLARLFEGADAVVHLAGLAHVNRASQTSVDGFERGNVTATGRVVSAAAEVGVRRFVHLSSASIFGNETSFIGINDETLPQPSTPYARSKLSAEQVVLHARASNGLSTVILRPPMVFGPRMKGNPARLFSFVRNRLPMPVLARTRRSMIYVGNLAAGIVAAVNSDAPTSLPYIVADEPALSIPELVDLVSRAFDLKPKTVSFPPSVLSAVTRISRFLHVGSGISLLLDRLSQSFVVDGRRFRRDFEYQAPYSIAQGIQLTADWYRRT